MMNHIDQSIHWNNYDEQFASHHDDLCADAVSFGHYIFQRRSLKSVYKSDAIREHGGLDGSKNYN
jgi:hypothetical protein